MSRKKYFILAIDTSCDDTAAAVTGDDWVYSNVISSQVKYHQQYGGVVPNVAKRMHQELIEPTVREALLRAGKTGEEMDAVAVTVGPGLAPALEVGIDFAKKKAEAWGKPLIAVNHMEAHLLSPLAKNSRGKNRLTKSGLELPCLGLLISGGHTQLVLMNKLGQYRLLGETLDDAAGEAFDKVAKMLKLGYPGGPVISELAKEGEAIYQLPIPMAKSGDLNFSFSGLKTACLYRIQAMKTMSRKTTVDFAASFVEAVARALTVKLKKAIENYKPKQILLGGGVVNNVRIRQAVRTTAGAAGLPVLIAYDKRLFSDNAAMVGVCAWYQSKRKDFVKKAEALDRLPGLNF